MDEVLREALRTWFPGQSDVHAIPERPIYVFDGEPRSDAKLRIQVLDRDGFEPLRQQMSWLNDNLVLKSRLEGDVANLITTLAAEASRETLALRVKTQAESAETQFAAAADEVNQAMVDGASLLVSTIDHKISEIAEQCSAATVRLAGRREVLKEVTRALEDAEALEQQVDQAVDETGKMVEEKVAKLCSAVRRLTKADESRIEIEKTLTTKIEKLLRLYDEQRRRLRDRGLRKGFGKSQRRPAGTMLVLWGILLTFQFIVFLTIGLRWLR